MTMHDESETERLDALLRDAARDRGVPPGLSARVIADAGRVQPRALRRSTPAGWRSLLVGLGGWRSLGGLVAATCAGFWIGISPPAGLPDAGGLVVGDQIEASLELIDDSSGFGWDLEEG